MWQENEFGRGGAKSVNVFTAAERGANKAAYSRRKILWDVVEAMARRGHTSDTAIDKIYSVYERSCSVTDVLAGMRVDRQTGGHRELC
jgi:hypothetical protein